jgi:putative membrane protein
LSGNEEELVMEWLSDGYAWVKTVHILAVISWMAGMLYLPRLYVYHSGAEAGSVQSETFKVMERRLLRAIINPAMIAAWITGVMLAFTPGIIDWSVGWVWVKLTALLAMQLIHAAYAHWRRHFANDANRHDHRFYRVMNEVPTVLMIVIVIMVVVRPF